MKLASGITARLLLPARVRLTKPALKVVGLIGVLALISAGYCFWLMTVHFPMTGCTL